jgi:hypothetical protein
VYGESFSKKDIITIGLSLIIMFSALSLYHPVANLGIITSNPEKPGPLVVMNNLEIIVDSQFFASNGHTIKVNSSFFNGYVIIFSSMGSEVKRVALQQYKDKLRSAFSLQPDRYTIRVVLRFTPTAILSLYNIRSIINNNNFMLVIVSNDTFSIIKDITVVMNSSSSVVVHMTINIAETSIFRTEIFDYYTNGNVDKKYVIRLTYNYNSYGELYKNILFLIGSSHVQLNVTNSNLSETVRLLRVVILSNADEKITEDKKAYFDNFVVDLETSIIPLFFVHGVIRIAWYVAEVGS